MACWCPQDGGGWGALLSCPGPCTNTISVVVGRGEGILFSDEKRLLSVDFFVWFNKMKQTLLAYFFAKSFGWISWGELMASATFQLRAGNKERDSCPDKRLPPAESPHLQGMALFLPHGPHF